MRADRLRPLIAALALLFCLAALLPARAEEDERVWTLLDETGRVLTRRAAPMSVDDEYISGNDELYRVVSVDGERAEATARDMGPEPRDAAVFAGGAALAESADSGKKLICMYSTHSDESYVPSDGEASKLKDAGIFDVGNALKDNLEKLGIETVYSEETFYPHDAGAYTRSRAVAEELLKKGPDALIDVHRDATPKEEYETKVDGDETSKVRLFVGRSNPNAAVNRQFAKRIKAAADEKYPGLVKDIFIGRGNYNQELSGNSILLEFGTHEIEKEKAMDATKYMADVLNDVLFGGSAEAEGISGQTKKDGGAVTKGVVWTILAALAAAAAYAFFSTGSGRSAMRRLRRGASEMTGGLAGEKPKDGDARK